MTTPTQTRLVGKALIMSTRELAPLTPEKRRKEARERREEALDISLKPKLPEHRNNGEEMEYIPRYGFPVANYSKALPHDALGRVDRDAYEKLLKALREGDPEDFERIPLGLSDGLRLTNPQAGLAFELEGPDPQSVTIPPAPRLGSRQNDAEMVELYWMSLLRDVPFTRFESNPDVAAAATELETYRDVLQVPRVGRITPRTVFRGFTEGDLPGPYLSQFLLRDIPYGSLLIPQRQRTLVPGRDYLTRFDEWLGVQNGRFPGEDDLDPAGPRYLRNMRDVSRYVHVDALYEAYLNAALILLGLRVRDDGGNPYTESRNQQGFGTFGGPEILSLVTEVATRALRAVWFQKWFVHRRLRPEEYGGRVDLRRRKLAGLDSRVVTDALLSSTAHQRVLSRFGSSLLPQAFKEGSPTHPAYGAGHATVGGACVTILKAWFIGGDPLPGQAVVPNEAGTELVPYTGPDAGSLTIGGELDKLASNIAIGRDMAGVHWRSDYTQSVLLGERIALGLLREQSILYNEDHLLTLVTFEGRTLKISKGEIKDTTGN
jgi:hypothetical protein